MRKKSFLGWLLEAVEATLNKNCGKVKLGKFSKETKKENYWMRINLSSIDFVDVVLYFVSLVKNLFEQHLRNVKIWNGIVKA